MNFSSDPFQTTSHLWHEIEYFGPLVLSATRVLGQILLERGFEHFVICLKFCWAQVIMTFPPEWAAALAVICSMCVRAIFNSTFRKHQSLSKSKRNHCQLNKFWTLNSKTHHNSPHFFPSPTCIRFVKMLMIALIFHRKIVAVHKIT